MGGHEPPEDPVVVYDIMREAASRLMGFHIQRVTVGGFDDPAIRAARNVLLEAEAIPTHDKKAQRAATQSFQSRYEELRSES